MTQEQALEILKMGQNVFLTGPAGSGKTYLLNQYIKYLKKHEISVAITASTGIASTHMNGRTIHSWSAIGINIRLTPQQLNALFFNEQVRARIKKAKVLIIDEISMLDSRRFELVERVCRRLREDQSPFGGLQIVLSGDFFQLPPVPDTRGGPIPQFAFTSDAWKKSAIKICYLEKQYRQSDKRFLQVLNTIRNNEDTEMVYEILRERYQQPILGVANTTKLYALNNDVDALNDFELAQINLPEKIYTMTSEGELDLIKELKRGCLAPQRLALKKGAWVMFVKNNFVEDNAPENYVNGTLGTIVGFDDNDGYPIVEKKDGQRIVAKPNNWTIEEDGVVIARISQVPLRLAWAITIHKSQGMSLDHAEINLSNAFVEGMGYVALSRVKSLDGVKLMGLNKMALSVSPEITELDEALQESSDQTLIELEKLSSAEKRQVQKVFLSK